MENKLTIRPRRLRSSPAVRDLVQETRLSASDFVWPVFVVEGSGVSEPIASMPSSRRWSIDLLVEEAQRAQSLGIRGMALFPKIEGKLKDPQGSISLASDGLVVRAIEKIKSVCPEMLLFADIALDPYSSDGHDGIVVDGKIDNDSSLEALAEMALVFAAAGADWVAPSDMMDGRVGAIRKRLDSKGFQDVGILSYTAKYASSFYGPFRDALGSAPKAGDKKTYQMDPANSKEGLRELSLDIAEGADIVMVKPALPYLDVLSAIKKASPVPVAAYQVSGEISMIEAAAEKGWIDRTQAIEESLTCIKRAGADIIFSYAALEVAQSKSLKC